MKKYMNNKGITLIALVITIIVLLLLAGISISMLSGQDGILNKATEAKNKTRVTEIEEAISFWRIEKQMDEYVPSEENNDESLVDYLVREGLITENEKAEAEANNGELKIGDETVTVMEISVTSVTVSGESEIITEEEIQLTAEILPDNATNKNVTWSSSDEEIATVDSTGKVTGISAGEVEITATVEGKTDTYTITVSNSIKFMLNDIYYYAKEGSDWSTWIESRYCPDDLNVSINSSNSQVMLGDLFVWDGDGGFGPVYKTDEILGQVGVGYIQSATSPNR